MIFTLGFVLFVIGRIYIKYFMILNTSAIWPDQLFMLCWLSGVLLMFASVAIFIARYLP